MHDLNQKRNGRVSSVAGQEERREAILDTATELFAEQGFSDAMTQAIAERLNLGKGTIYRYFSSKRELFLAAADRVMRKMLEAVNEKIAGEQDGLRQVVKGTTAFLAFFSEHPKYVELLIQERAFFKDRKRPTFDEHREVNGRRWQLLYTRLIAEGRVRPMDVQQISEVIGNLLYGTMFTNYFAGRHKPVAQQAHEIIDIVFRGILSDEERASFLANLPDSDASEEREPPRPTSRASSETRPGERNPQEAPRSR